MVIVPNWTALFMSFYKRDTGDITQSKSQQKAKKYGKGSHQNEIEDGRPWEILHITLYSLFFPMINCM